MRGTKPSLENVIPMKGDHIRRAPPPPEHLDDNAAEVWRRLAPVLINKGRLEPEYEDSFAAYCVMVGHVVSMSHEVAMMGSWYEVKTRNGMQQKHRASWVQLTQAVAGMNQLAARFGLTPVDEARLKSGGQADLFDDLMRSLDGAD